MKTLVFSALIGLVSTLSSFGTVPSPTSKIQYVLTTNPQTLTVPFVFQNSSDLLVIDSNLSTGRDPAVTLIQNSDYSVTGGAGSTGTVITIPGGTNAVLVGDTITILRGVPITQTTSFTNTGPLTATMIGQAFDKLTMIAQQLNEVQQRSLQFEPFENLPGNLIFNQRLSSLLGFDSNANIKYYAPPTGGGGGGGVAPRASGLFQINSATAQVFGISYGTTLTPAPQYIRLTFNYPSTNTSIVIGGIYGTPTTTGFEIAINPVMLNTTTTVFWEAL